MASITVLNPLQKIYYRSIRIIAKIPYKAHTNPISHSLNLLKTKDICTVLEIAKSMFKINKAPFLCQYPNLKLIKDTCNYNSSIIFLTEKNQKQKKIFFFYRSKNMVTLTLGDQKLLIWYIQKEVKVTSY